MNLSRFFLTFHQAWNSSTVDIAEMNANAWITHKLETGRTFRKLLFWWDFSPPSGNYTFPACSWRTGTGSCNRLSAAQCRFPEKRGCEIKMANGLLHDPCGRCPSWICTMMVTPFQPSPPRFFFLLRQYACSLNRYTVPLDWGIQSRTEHGEMGLYLNWIFKSTNPKNQPVIIHRGTTPTGVDCGGGRQGLCPDLWWFVHRSIPHFPPGAGESFSCADGGPQ